MRNHRHPHQSTGRIYGAAVAIGHHRPSSATGVGAEEAAAEVEAARGRDPIARLAALLAEAGVLAAELEGDRDEAAAEMQDAYDDARAAPFPDPAEALRDVQDVGSPEQEAY